jgi:DNA modification methylase
MKEILTTFTCEGSKILVPFLGSGKTLLAAYESKMTAFGTDLGEEHRESFVSSLTTLMQ